MRAEVVELLERRRPVRVSEVGDEGAVGTDVGAQADGGRRTEELPVARIGRLQAVLLVLRAVVVAVRVVAVPPAALRGPVVVLFDAAAEL